MSAGRPKGSKDSIKRKGRLPKETVKMLGNKYGKLLILRMADNWTENTHIRMPLICQCDCGNIKEMCAYDIRYRKVYSCGCAQLEWATKGQIKSNNHAAKQKLYNTYKSGASTRNLIFNLTKEQLLDISLKNCYYCNIEPKMISKTKGGSIVYNGIDRVDNSKGYELDNVVPCCWDCNISKGSTSLNIAEKMINFIKVKNES